MYLTWNHCVWSLLTIIQPITLIATSAVAIVVSNPSNCDGRSTGSKATHVRLMMGQQSGAVAATGRRREEGKVGMDCLHCEKRDRQI